MASALLGVPEIAETQNNKHITHNDGIARLEQSTNAHYVNTAANGTDITISPDDASFYFLYKFSGATANKKIIFPAQRNGNNRKRIFAVQNNSLFNLTVEASTGTGTDVVVTPGFTVLIHQDFEDMNALSSFNNTINTPVYDLGFFIPDSPTSADTVAIFTVVRQFELPDNFVGAVGFCGTNPSATAVFNVYRNTTLIGTVSINTSGVFTFATSGSGVETFTVGQRLRLEAPAPQDSTLADIAITFKGTRT